ncbi:hypothetical protein CP532_2873 [Ophiocordyceps camponoti-leonardi (nom. inval.)]|nr:hypothetical protein CP532_2873 [Ophiocordyceps camponoti-leonardi (nom. inval.)]
MMLLLWTWAWTLLTLVTVVNSASSVASIKNVFNVNLDDNSAGGCGWVGAAAMETLFSECLTLAKAGLRAIDEYDTSDAAKRLIDAFFRGKKEAPLIPGQLQEIRDHWLNHGGPVNDGAVIEKPHLFCSDSWLTKLTMQDQARNKNGDEIWDTKADGSRSPVTIGSINEYIQKQQNERNALRGTGPQNAQAVPYYSVVHKDYIFDSFYGSYDPQRGYCTPKSNQAATQHIMSPSSITLCPWSFGTRTRAPADPKIKSLRHQAAEPVDTKPARRIKYAGITKPAARGRKFSGKQELASLMPTAATLFHETFHLVMGNARTTPNSGEVYPVAKMLGLKHEDAVVNPETFAAVAVAYDYTLNTDVDEDGNVVEFFTGYTTRG